MSLSMRVSYCTMASTFSCLCMSYEKCCKCFLDIYMNFIAQCRTGHQLEAKGRKGRSEEHMDEAVVC